MLTVLLPYAGIEIDDDDIKLLEELTGDTSVLLELP